MRMSFARVRCGRLVKLGGVLGYFERGMTDSNITLHAALNHVSF